MPEIWIDDHTGDELTARPGFRESLRAELAAQDTNRHHAPWRAIAWSTAAAAVLVTGAVLLTRDDRNTVVPAGPTTATTPPTTVPSPTTVPDTQLFGQIVDITWIVDTADGSPIALPSSPSFVLGGDGGLTGFDGCNTYGYDAADGGGWTLNGATITLSQKIGSTSVLCPGVEPVLPIIDGAVLALDGSGGVLTITQPSGATYTAHPAGDEPPLPAPDLVVPAVGGPDLAPDVVATLDITTDERFVRAALLPDRFVVLPVVGFHFDGTVISVDRDGNRLPDTTLDVTPTDLAGIVLGGFDGTLYVETFPEVGNTQATLAYRLDGDVWREVDSFVVEDNNDGMYSVTDAGLMLGDTMVIPTSSTDPAGDRVFVSTYGIETFQIARAQSQGASTTWTVDQTLDPANPTAMLAPQVYRFGDGVLFTNSTSSAGGDYVGILRPGGSNRFERLAGWTLAGVDDTTALVIDRSGSTVRFAVITAAR